MTVIKLENIAMFTGELLRAGISTTDLPEPLQELIFRFHLASKACHEADDETKNRFLPVLTQADAIIAASIYQLYPPVEEPVQVDKIRLMALKAKALRMKLNTDE
jgi:hypothetical protein